MGQWGFATQNSLMQASIVACLAAMEALGWAPPLGHDEALLKIQEILREVQSSQGAEWSVCKRNLSGTSHSEDVLEIPAKRVCANNNADIPATVLTGAVALTDVNTGKHGTSA